VFIYQRSVFIVISFNYGQFISIVIVRMYGETQILIRVPKPLRDQLFQLDLNPKSFFGADFDFFRPNL